MGAIIAASHAAADANCTMARHERSRSRVMPVFYGTPVWAALKRLSMGFGLIAFALGDPAGFRLEQSECGCGCVRGIAAVGRAHRSARSQERGSGHCADGAGDCERQANHLDGDALHASGGEFGRPPYHDAPRPDHPRSSGCRKRRLRPDDLLARFEEVRRAEQLDESASQMRPNSTSERLFPSTSQCGTIARS